MEWEVWCCVVWCGDLADWGPSVDHLLLVDHTLLSWFESGGVGFQAVRIRAVIRGVRGVNQGCGLEHLAKANFIMLCAVYRSFPPFFKPEFERFRMDGCNVGGGTPSDHVDRGASLSTRPTSSKVKSFCRTISSLNVQ